MQSWHPQTSLEFTKPLTGLLAGWLAHANITCVYMQQPEGFEQKDGEDYGAHVVGDEDHDDCNNNDEVTGCLKDHPYAQHAREANKDSKVEVEVPKDSEDNVEEGDELVDSEYNESLTGPKGKGKAQGAKTINNNPVHRACKGRALGMPKHDDPDMYKSTPKWEGDWTLLIPATEKNNEVHTRFIGKWHCKHCKKNLAECIISSLKHQCDACTLGHRSPCEIMGRYTTGNKMDDKMRQNTTAPTTSSRGLPLACDNCPRHTKDRPAQACGGVFKRRHVGQPGQGQQHWSCSAKQQGEDTHKVQDEHRHTHLQDVGKIGDSHAKQVHQSRRHAGGQAVIGKDICTPGPLNAKNVKVSQKTSEKKSTHALQPEASETIIINSDSADDQPLCTLVASAASRPDAPEDAMDIDQLQVVEAKGKSRAGNPRQLPEVVPNDSQPDDPVAQRSQHGGDNGLAR
ncbi:uncharacterized protein C8Q71DRAFT_727127 [Rhodofomes roseus]|uniref:Zn(2)-C6 fungal-type domain-containing protein n=1 Tax=Rhodofomes roseus TaxID=34475 RepID=A0ABQ8K2I4_9APHY|nr:uncharacterized protein C8Q71DRAFT_727127 [Rhodofomes roseus]KAH9830935.1 hypothetical protein C8Q71DRAFT_727127 [Rhodofomes roseus]